MTNNRRPAGFQRWNHLLFAHWAVAPEIIQASLPPGLTVDTFGGAGYLGIVPFFMQRVRPALLPAVPWLSWFLELNVRTYVLDAAGRPGVWFYSLDCNQPVAVRIARRFFHLPYFDAAMSAQRDGPTITYRCRRKGRPEAECHFRWTPEQNAAPAVTGTLEHFLVERYRLFSVDARGRHFEGNVRHQPYRICVPQVAECSTIPASQAGFDLAGPPASLLSAEAVDVAVYPLLGSSPASSNAPRSA